MPSTAGGWISAATLNPSTPLANTQTRRRIGRVEPIDANGIDTHNKHNSRQPEKSTRRSGARFHYSASFQSSRARLHLRFSGKTERRGAECSGEIEANCGFNATRGTQALSLTDTLPNCWHAFCSNHLRLTFETSNRSHFPASWDAYLTQPRASLFRCHVTHMWKQSPSVRLTTSTKCTLRRRRRLPLTSKWMGGRSGAVFARCIIILIFAAADDCKNPLATDTFLQSGMQIHNNQASLPPYSSVHQITIYGDDKHLPVSQVQTPRRSRT